jgi:hypothetical protein
MYVVWGLLEAIMNDMHLILVPSFNVVFAHCAWEKRHQWAQGWGWVYSKNE